MAIGVEIFPMTQIFEIKVSATVFSNRELFFGYLNDDGNNVLFLGVCILLCFWAFL